ncbi:MAG: phenylalanine 4-monooxygenase [Minwuia sp.]|uniref:phenylalanine 4-monooxygenase n=1 Tax=Minwuia sp. TaxID=2493630 RepID=UPI003A8AD571
MSRDAIIDQGYEAYTDQDHETWRLLFERQAAMLPGRAAPEFVDGLDALGVDAGGIPNFERLSDRLEDATGWRIVAVQGLISDEVFFDLLSRRRFPVTNWIRKPEQLDYLQEPDCFHDCFGHVPMLFNPVFADYMAAYGRGGLKALRLGALKNLARLYWYTVEFGLIATPEGLRIYGAGIVSSKGESIFALDDPAPNRLAFDLMRIMQTDYIIDHFQQTYFVIDSYDQLFEATRPDFSPYYDELKGKPAISPDTVLETDRRV